MESFPGSTLAISSRRGLDLPPRVANLGLCGALPTPAKAIPPRTNPLLRPQKANSPAGTTLIALGLEKPPAPPPPPPRPAPPPPPVEDIVCAAADAMNVLPRDVRPALLAAFTRTRRLGLGVEVVERALSATKPPSP